MIWKTSIDRAFLPLKLSIYRGLNTNLQMYFSTKTSTCGWFSHFFWGVLESLGDSQSSPYGCWSNDLDELGVPELGWFHQEAMWRNSTSPAVSVLRSK
jgi:hypothetical protein